MVSVEDGASLFRPDYFRPSQWRDLHRRSDDPIRNLLRAVLEISLRDATGVRRVRGIRRRTRSCSAAVLVRAEAKRSRQVTALRRDALAWIFCDGGGVFSFRSVCETLEISADKLRECVNAKR